MTAAVSSALYCPEAGYLQEATVPTPPCQRRSMDSVTARPSERGRESELARAEPRRREQRQGSAYPGSVKLKIERQPRRLSPAVPKLRVVLTNRSAPPATVTPVLVYPDVRAAVAWLESAFGFRERVRIGDAHRAQLAVGDDGAVVVADVRREHVAPAVGAVTHVIKVRVPDVDAAYAQARDAGARVVMEPNS